MLESILFNKFKVYTLPNDNKGTEIRGMQGGQLHKMDLWLAMVNEEPDLIVDVGFNYGEFSLISSGRDIPIIGIEPHPLVLECARKNIEGLSDIRLIDSLVGNYTGEGTLYYDLNGSSGNSSMEKKVHDIYKNNNVKEHRCPIDTLDNLIKARPYKLLLKIDVEGFEPEVIEGAKELLDKAQSAAIFLEFSNRRVEARGMDRDEWWQKTCIYPPYAFFHREDINTLHKQAQDKAPPYKPTEVVMLKNYPIIYKGVTYE